MADKLTTSNISQSSYVELITIEEKLEYAVIYSNVDVNESVNALAFNPNHRILPPIAQTPPNFVTVESSLPRTLSAYKVDRSVKKSNIVNLLDFKKYVANENVETLTKQTDAVCQTANLTKINPSTIEEDNYLGARFRRYYSRSDKGELIATLSPALGGITPYLNRLGENATKLFAESLYNDRFIAGNWGFGFDINGGYIAQDIKVNAGRQYLMVLTCANFTTLGQGITGYDYQPTPSITYGFESAKVARSKVEERSTHYLTADNTKEPYERYTGTITYTTYTVSIYAPTNKLRVFVESDGAIAIDNIVLCEIPEVAFGCEGQDTTTNQLKNDSFVTGVESWADASLKALTPTDDPQYWSAQYAGIIVSVDGTKEVTQLVSGLKVGGWAVFDIVLTVLEPGNPEDSIEYGVKTADEKTTIFSEKIRRDQIPKPTAFAVPSDGSVLVYIKLGEIGTRAIITAARLCVMTKKSDIQAALGQPQLSNVDSFNSKLGLTLGETYYWNQVLLWNFGDGLELGGADYGNQGRSQTPRLNFVAANELDQFTRGVGFYVHDKSWSGYSSYLVTDEAGNLLSDDVYTLAPEDVLTRNFEWPSGSSGAVVGLRLSVADLGIVTITTILDGAIATQTIVFDNFDVKPILEKAITITTDNNYRLTIQITAETSVRGKLWSGGWLVDCPYNVLRNPLFQFMAENWTDLDGNNINTDLSLIPYGPSKYIPPPILTLDSIYDPTIVTRIAYTNHVNLSTDIVFDILLQSPLFAAVVQSDGLFPVVPSEDNKLASDRNQRYLSVAPTAGFKQIVDGLKPGAYYYISIDHKGAFSLDNRQAQSYIFIDPKEASSSAYVYPRLLIYDNTKFISAALKISLVGDGGVVIGSYESSMSSWPIGDWIPWKGNNNRGFMGPYGPIPDNGQVTLTVQILNQYKGLLDRTSTEAKSRIPLDVILQAAVGRVTLISTTPSNDTTSPDVTDSDYPNSVFRITSLRTGTVKQTVVPNLCGDKGILISYDDFTRSTGSWSGGTWAEKLGANAILLNYDESLTKTFQGLTPGYDFSLTFNLLEPATTVELQTDTSTISNSFSTSGIKRHSIPITATGTVSVIFRQYTRPLPAHVDPVESKFVKTNLKTGLVEISSDSGKAYTRDLSTNEPILLDRNNISTAKNTFIITKDDPPIVVSLPGFVDKQLTQFPGSGREYGGQDTYQYTVTDTYNITDDVFTLYLGRPDSIPFVSLDFEHINISVYENTNGYKVADAYCVIYRVDLDLPIIKAYMDKAGLQYQGFAVPSARYPAIVGDTYNYLNTDVSPYNAMPNELLCYISALPSPLEDSSLTRSVFEKAVGDLNRIKTNDDRIRPLVIFYNHIPSREALIKRKNWVTGKWGIEIKHTSIIFGSSDSNEAPVGYVNSRGIWDDYRRRVTRYLEISEGLPTPPPTTPYKVTDIIACMAPPVATAITENKITTGRLAIEWKGTPRTLVNIFNLFVRYKLRNPETNANTIINHLPKGEGHLGYSLTPIKTENPDAACYETIVEACDYWKQSGNGGRTENNILANGLAEANVTTINPLDYADVTLKSNWLWSIPTLAIDPKNDRLIIDIPPPPDTTTDVIEDIEIFYLTNLINNQKKPLRCAPITIARVPRQKGEALEGPMSVPANAIAKIDKSAESHQGDASYYQWGTASRRIVFDSRALIFFSHPRSLDSVSKVTFRIVARLSELTVLINPAVDNAALVATVGIAKHDGTNWYDATNELDFIDGNRVPLDKVIEVTKRKVYVDGQLVTTDACGYMGTRNEIYIFKDFDYHTIEIETDLSEFYAVNKGALDLIYDGFNGKDTDRPSTQPYRSNHQIALFLGLGATDFGTNAENLTLTAYFNLSAAEMIAYEGVPLRFAANEGSNCTPDPAQEFDVVLQYSRNDNKTHEYRSSVKKNDLYSQEADITNWDKLTSIGNGVRGTTARWQTAKFTLDAPNGQGLDQQTPKVTFIASGSGNINVMGFDTTARARYADKCDATITIAEIRKGVVGNSTQSIVLPSPTAGTWNLTVTVRGVARSTTLQWNVTKAGLQTAIGLLSNVQPGNVTVTGTGKLTDPFIVIFLKALAGVDIPLMTADSANLTGGTTAYVTKVFTGTKNERQEVAMYANVLEDLVLSFGGSNSVRIKYNATLDQKQAAIGAMNTIGVGNVIVTGDTADRTIPYIGNLVVEFVGAFANSNVPQMTVANTTKYTVKTLVQGGSGINDTQKVTINASAGYFRLRITNPNNDTVIVTTGPIQYNATGPEVAAAIDAAASFITEADILVTRLTDLTATTRQWEVQFIGSLSGLPVKQMGIEAAFLKGGEITIASLTAGGSRSEQQRMTLRKANAGYYFLRVTLNGATRTTARIAYNATAYVVQQSLIALSNVNDGDIIVTKNTNITDRTITSEFILTYKSSFGDVINIVPIFRETLKCNPIITEFVDPPPYPYPLPKQCEIEDLSFQSGPLLSRPCDGSPEVQIMPALPLSESANVTRTLSIKRDLFNPDQKTYPTSGEGKLLTIKDMVKLKGLNPSQYTPYLRDASSNLSQTTYEAVPINGQSIVVIDNKIIASGGLRNITRQLNSRREIIPSRNVF